jgi:hypothetical protein
MSKELTHDEIATNYETMKHIRNVQRCINIILNELIDRAEKHDQTKLESPEVEGFTIVTPKLAGSTYGSEEYKGFLAELKPTLEHHYSRNRHHPENHKSGINDMNIIDICEMLCDWKAATIRHTNGNLKKSIEYNKDRFDMSSQLVKILENSISLFDNIKD